VSCLTPLHDPGLTNHYLPLGSKGDSRDLQGDLMNGSQKNIILRQPVVLFQATWRKLTVARNETNERNRNRTPNEEIIP